MILSPLEIELSRSSAGQRCGLLNFSGPREEAAYADVLDLVTGMLAYEGHDEP
jgi:hypothetical protein